MKRLTLMTAFWRRPEISAIWWAATRRMRDTLRKEAWDLSVSAVYSPEDPDIEANTALGMKHKEWTANSITPNRPLTNKMNLASSMARGFQPDYLMLMDSDDIFDDDLIRGFAGLMQSGVAHTGLRDFHFYDGGKLLHWPGYPPGHVSHGRSIGCGRIYSRFVAETAGWRIWEDSVRERGMDAQADKRMAKFGVPRPSISMKQVGGFGVDIKSAANIWSLDKLKVLPGAKFVDLAPVQALPEWPMIAALAGLEVAPLSQ